MKEMEEDIAYRPWSERGWFLIDTKRAKQSDKRWQEMPVFRGSECLGPSWNRIPLSPIHQSSEPFFGISSLLPNLDFYELLFQKDFWMSHYPHLSGHNSPKSNHMNNILLSVSLLYSCNAGKKKTHTAGLQPVLRDEVSPNECCIICLFFVVILPSHVNVYWTFLFINTMLMGTTSSPQIFSYLRTWVWPKRLFSVLFLASFIYVTINIEYLQCIRS